MNIQKIDRYTYKIYSDDNDPSKIGKRLYGTENYIFKMDEVKKYNNITLLIYKGPYIEEMMNQLNNYNKNINYIIV